MKQFTFGERLRAMRKQRDLSQKQCAEKLGIDGTQWSHWECMVYIPSVPSLAKIARALHLSPHEVHQLVMSTDIAVRLFNQVKIL